MINVAIDFLVLAQLHPTLLAQFHHSIMSNQVSIVLLLFLVNGNFNILFLVNGGGSDVAIYSRNGTLLMTSTFSALAKSGSLCANGGGDPIVSCNAMCHLFLLLQNTLTLYCR
jgi:hypothetical protein